MFCSKCGKQISDDAAFCEGCGNPTGAVQNSAAQQQVVYVQTIPAEKNTGGAVSRLPDKEKEWKILAISMFIAQTVVTLGFLIAIIASEGKMIFSIIGNMPKWALEEVWKEVGGFCYFLTSLYAAVQIFTGIVHYLLSYIKRTFSELKRQVIGSCIADALMSGVMPIAIGVVAAEETDGEMPFMLIFIAIILLTLNIVTAVFYHKAAEIEAFEKYKERKGGAGSASKPSMYDSNRALSRLTNVANGGNGSIPSKWTCNSCGTLNNNTDSFCSGCGKYK